MVIERDRYLDDGREWLVTLALRSRTAAAHSLLSALDEEERRAVADSLAHALDEITRLLDGKRARLPRT
jgi:DNA-binding MarR family transcriptional regulator